MVADFEDYAELHGGVTADAIRSAADDPNAHTATVQALIGDLADDDAAVASNVEGDITDATQMNLQPAGDAARRLAQNGTYAIGLLNSFAATVATFDTEVKAINDELHTNTSRRFTAEHQTQSGDEGGADGDAPDPPSYDEIKAQEKAKLQGRYDRAARTLEDEADSVAGKFEAGPTEADVKALVLAGYIALPQASLWPNLHLTNAELKTAQINTVKNMTDAEQVEYVRNTKELDPDIASVITPTAQETLANDVAGDIKDKDIDADTARIMSFLRGQEAFAHAVYTQVSPHEMADAIEELEDDAFPDVGGVHGTTDEKDLYKNFLTAAGTTLATYSKADPDGPYAPPPADELTKTWFDAITNGDHKDDAAALTLLIKAGGQETSYETDFIKNLVGQTYEWERDQDGAVWGPRNSDFMDPFADVDSSVDARSGLIDYKSGFAVDGLANLLGGLEHSPEAAKDFFHGNFDGAQHSLDETMDYLVGGEDGRTWDSGDESDDGDGLGKALAAATVGEEHRTPEGTEIANKLLENIQEYGGKGDGTFTDEWHIGPQMTDSLGKIMSGYTGDLYTALEGGRIPDGATHLDLGDDQTSRLHEVLGELGRGNKDGLETLTTAMLMQGQAEYSDQLGAVNGPHTLDNLNGAGLEGVQQTNGKVMGLLLEHGLSLASDEDKSDEARAAILSKAVDITAGFLPGAGDILGEGASHLSKATLDTMSGEAIDGLKKGLEAAPDTDEYLNSNADDLDRKIQYLSLDALAQNGYLGQQDTKVGPFDGLSPDVMTGNPPHIDPRLYDSDGDDIDTSDMSDSEKAQVRRMQEAWSDFLDSKPSNIALDLTYQGTFKSHFIDPELG